MVKRSVSTAIAFLLLIAAASYAKDQHAPLSPAIMSAKTVYIDNQAGGAEFADRCYTELKKWGRFTIVQSPEEADIVFLISSDSRRVVTGSNTVPIGYGAQTSVHSQTVGSTTISIVDRHTGNLLWSDARRWGFRSATVGVVKELRKRMEEQQSR